MRTIFLICWACMYPVCCTYAQIFRTIEKEDNYKNDIYQTISPPPPDSVTMDVIGRFVVKESNRFRLALHPAFAKLDSFAPTGSAQRALLEKNPYAIFPEMAGYRYKPQWSVLRIRNGDYMFRHLYWVEIKECFYLDSPAVAKPVRYDINGHCYSQYSDDNYNDEKRPIFFPNDGLYAVFYNKETGEMSMLGGNAFLSDWPDGAFIYGAGTDTNESKLFAFLRTVHFSRLRVKRPTDERIVESVWHATDSVAPPINLFPYDPRFHAYVYYYRPNYMEPAKGIYPTEGVATSGAYADIICVQVGRPALDSIPPMQDFTDRTPEPRRRIPYAPPVPWAIQLKLYVEKDTQLHPTIKNRFPKGNFPVYEVIYDIINTPTHYNQVLPTVWGLRKETWEEMKRKDPRLTLNKN